ncbi:MAG TPA: L,D-transpeptidase family protein [Gammaproteobacteria bacterium]
MRIFWSLIVVFYSGLLHAEVTSVDRVVVHKAKRLMQLQFQGKVVKSYTISLGDKPRGHKVQQGDEKTPEGSYVIDYRNVHSNFHRSLHISYPNPQDRANAKRLGVDPGGMIMIHGLPNGYGWAKVLFVGRDWTDGCVAVSDEQIEEIWALVKDGTPITIKP